MQALRFSILILILFILPQLRAQLQAVGEKVTRTIYNDAGILTHKITAQTVTYGKGPARFDDTQILCFDPADPSKVIQTVRAKVAYYDQTHARIYGQDKVKMTSSDLDLTATGFVLELDSSRLTLEHDVVGHAATADLFCRTAVVTLSKEKISTDDKLSRVERLEANGEVRLVNKKTGKRTFDEALSESADYEGKTGMLVCTKGVTTLLDGKPVYTAEGRLQYPLRD